MKKKQKKSRKKKERTSSKSSDLNYSKLLLDTHNDHSDNSTEKKYIIFDSLSKGFDFIKICFYSAIHVLIFFLFILIFFQAYQILEKKRPIFKEFNTPSTLKQQGYDGMEVIRLIVDEMNSIRKNAKTLASRGKSKTEVINAMPDLAHKEITMGGIEFSIENIVDLIIHVLGFRQLYINGTLTKTKDDLCLTVRISKRPSKSFQSHSKNLNNIIKKAALHILKILEPLTIGIDYFVKGNISELKQLIHYVLDNNPTDENKAAAFIMDGFIFSIQGNHKQALKRYILAEKIKPDNTIAYYMSADAYRWLNQPEKAIEKYKICLKLNSKNIEVQTKWAEALIELQKTEEAHNKYNEIIKLAPNNARIYINWGDILTFKLKKPKDGIEKYKKAAELEPGNSDIFAKWGNALIQQNKKEEAIVKFETALRLNSKNISVYLDMGNLFVHHLNQPEKGLECFKKASTITPNVAEIYSTWGMSLLQLNQPEQAIDKFQTAIKL